MLGNLGNLGNVPGKRAEISAKEKLFSCPSRTSQASSAFYSRCQSRERMRKEIIILIRTSVSLA